MAKSTATCWNPPDSENRKRWTPIPGPEGVAEEPTLGIDPIAGEYARPTRFLPGTNAAPFSGRTHLYPEEVFVVGRLHDRAFDLWPEAGHRASRPPGELHGPLRTDAGRVVLEVSFPDRVGDGPAI